MLLVLLQERRAYGFGTTWGRVINDWIFIFGWTIPLRFLKLTLSFFSCNPSFTKGSLNLITKGFLSLRAFMQPGPDFHETLRIISISPASPSSSCLGSHRTPPTGGFPASEPHTWNTHTHGEHEDLARSRSELRLNHASLTAARFSPASGCSSYTCESPPSSCAPSQCTRLWSSHWNTTFI